MIALSLPYPPTGNHSTKHTKSGGHYATAEVKAYRQHIGLLVASKRAAVTKNGHEI